MISDKQTELVKSSIDDIVDILTVVKEHLQEIHPEGAEPTQDSIWKMAMAVMEQQYRVEYLNLQRYK